MIKNLFATTLLAASLAGTASAQVTFTEITVPTHAQKEVHGVGISKTDPVAILLTDHSRNGHYIFPVTNGTIGSPTTINPGYGALQATGTQYGFMIDDLSGSFGATSYDETGTFIDWTAGTTQFNSGRCEPAAVADYNGDGNDDCAASDGAIYSNNTATTLATGLGRGWAAGQFGGDSRVDVFTSSGLWIQQSDGSFVLDGNGPTVVSDIFSAVACDFDGDGDDDLVQGPGSGSVQVWRNDGSSWANISSGSEINITHTDFPDGNYHELLCADLDGDGNEDFLNTYDYRVMLSDGDGTFTLTYTLDNHVRGPATAKPNADFGDLNGDSIPDVCWQQEGYLKCALVGRNAPSAPLIVVGPPITVGQRHNFINKQLSGPLNYLDERTSNLNDLNTWMYDRVQVLYEQYLATGDAVTLAEAQASAIEYLQHYNRTGTNPGFADCLGGWSFASVNKCDRKFTHASACFYRLVIDGVSACDATLLDELRAYAMGSAWDASQLLDPVGDRISFPTTERNVGYSVMMLGHVEATARRAGFNTVADAALANINQVVEWLYDWQTADSYGGWMHSYKAHETIGTPYGGADDDLMFSPWQSAILTGALWRIWSVNNIKAKTCGPADDQWCIPTMLVRHAEGLENYGYIDCAVVNCTWRHPWNQSQQIAWYIAMPLDSARQTTVMDNEGFYADTHIPEIACSTALGYYFSDLVGASAADKQSYLDRWNALLPFFNLSGTDEDMASITSPTRIVGWMHSHNPSCEFLIERGA